MYIFRTLYLFLVNTVYTGHTRGINNNNNIRDQHIFLKGAAEFYGDF